MAHVFISYAHVDEDFALVLKQELERDGFEVWVDNERLRAGEDWRQGLDDAIKSALVVLVVMSPESFASNYVTYEWAFALGSNVKVIPIMLKDTPLHPRLEILQYLHFDNKLWNRLRTELHNELRKPKTGNIFISRDAPDAVKKAVAALDDHRREEREAALESLSQMKHPAAQEALAGAIAHPLGEVRILAAFLLATTSKYKDGRAIPGLIEALADSEEATQQTGFKALVEIGQSKLDVLAQYMDAEDLNTRRNIVRILGKIKGEAALLMVAKALGDADIPTKRIAYTILDAKNTDLLIEKLIDMTQATTDLVSRNYATAMLEAHMVPEIINKLEDSDGRVRKQAGVQLTKIGNPALSLLVKNLLNKRNKPNRTLMFYKNVVRVLGAIGDTSVIPELAIVLHDRDWSLQQTAAQTLEHFNTPEALSEIVPWWMKQLSNQSRYQKNTELRVCDTAAEVLSRIGTPEALAAVQEWKQSENRG